MYAIKCNTTNAFEETIPTCVLFEWVMCFLVSLEIHAHKKQSHACNWSAKNNEWAFLLCMHKCGPANTGLRQERVQPSICLQGLNTHSIIKSTFETWRQRWNGWCLCSSDWSLWILPFDWLSGLDTVKMRQLPETIFTRSHFNIVKMFWLFVLYAL